MAIPGDAASACVRVWGEDGNEDDADDDDEDDDEEDEEDAEDNDEGVLLSRRCCLPRAAMAAALGARTRITVRVNGFNAP